MQEITFYFMLILLYQKPFIIYRGSYCSSLNYRAQAAGAFSQQKFGIVNCNRDMMS